MLIATVAAITTIDATAEARCRARRACRPAPRACCNPAPVCGTNYSATGVYPSVTPAPMNSCCGNQVVYGNTDSNATGTVVDSTVPHSYPANVQQSGTQPNQPYSVSKPIYDSQPNASVPAANTQPAPAAPQPGISEPEAGVAPAPQPGSSPTDPDSEDRKASKIPGTAPTKAPAPAANAQP